MLSASNEFWRWRPQPGAVPAGFTERMASMSQHPTLIEIAPGLFRVRKDAPEPPKSDLPMPNVICDTMPPTEQVNGKFYESKSAFRRVGRSLGLLR